MQSDSPQSLDMILKELTPIFRRVFEDQSLVLHAEMTAADVADWDSLSHMDLILAIEEHFSIKLKLADIVKFKNVGDMCRVLLEAEG